MSVRDVQKEEEELAKGGARGRAPDALVVGHYCHDRLTLPDGVLVDALGGSVSYITNVFGALGLRAEVVSKVGPDFIYNSQLYPPTVVPGQRTTEFFADFTAGEERLLRVGNICEPIYAGDIVSENKYDIGLAVGIAGEILPETLERMTETSKVVVVDIQGLIRTFDPVSRLVRLRRLEETPFQSLLHRISYVKAASNEACYIDVEKVRKLTCLIVTEGADGCRVYTKEEEWKIPPFEATDVDPTGAGDSFLAGFSAGLFRGLSVYDAALVGNYFGSLAVGHVGVPRFTTEQLQRAQDLLRLRFTDGISDGSKASVSKFECTLQNGRYAKDVHL